MTRPYFLIFGANTVTRGKWRRLTIPERGVLLTLWMAASLQDHEGFWPTLTALIDDVGDEPDVPAIVDRLIELRWIDGPDEDGAYRIHDWPEWQPPLPMSGAERTRRWRGAPKLSTIDGGQPVDSVTKPSTSDAASSLTSRQNGHAEAPGAIHSGRDVSASHVTLARVLSSPLIEKNDTKNGTAVPALSDVTPAQRALRDRWGLTRLSDLLPSKVSSGSSEPSLTGDEGSDTESPAVLPHAGRESRSATLRRAPQGSQRCSSGTEPGERLADPARTSKLRRSKRVKGET